MAWLSCGILYTTPYVAAIPGLFLTALTSADSINGFFGVGGVKAQRSNYNSLGVFYTIILPMFTLMCMFVGPSIIVHTTVTSLQSLFLDEQSIEAWNAHQYTAAAIFVPTSVVLGFVTGFAFYACYVPYKDKGGEFTCIYSYMLSLLLVSVQLFTTVVLPHPIPMSPAASSDTNVETCNSEWISSENITGLHYAFRGHLFGQHIAQEQLPAILHGYFHDEDPQRALVLSFHGRTGTGKNHVSNLIAESIYKTGMRSQYVHLKVPQRDYPDKQKLQSYKTSLQEEIHSSVSRCARQLFIFDEVEDLPDGLLDTIKPYIDYHDKIDGVDFKRSIYIFLSNVAGREISEILLKHNSSRDSLRIRNFEQVIEKGSFNAKDTGLYHSRLLDSNLISHYIPFLPLERNHVELCIKDEAMKRGLPPLSEEAVSDIMEELQFWPEDTKQYAVKGCKNVREKMNLHIYSQQRSDL